MERTYKILGWLWFALGIYVVVKSIIEDDKLQSSIYATQAIGYWILCNMFWITADYYLVKRNASKS